MKVYLSSIGCRLNQSEIETLARQLLAAGHEIVTDPAAADKAIVNTCAVTREAAKDARSLARRLHRANGAAEIILTGCYATIAPEELAVIEGAGRVVPNAQKDKLLQILDPAASSATPIYDLEPALRDFLAGSSGNTRAFVKVQDGCDNRCTFCVTTVARGRGQSRHLGDVVAEIQALVTAGYREAVLTGVHLGSYGQDLGDCITLRDLVRAILDRTDLPRLRLSSLEPWDLSPDFFDLWADIRLLPHLHMPLQSGSDRILRRMARRTSRLAFRELAAAARERIPDLNLSTDLIAGFPGESDADFQETYAYVAELRFSRLHVFTYSRRPGTAAAAMDGQLPKPVKKERARQLIELGREMSQAFHRAYEDKVAEVLWETAVGAGENGVRWAGYTDNYIRVQADGPADLFNQITTTRLRDPRPEGMSGSILSPAVE